MTDKEEARTRLLLHPAVLVALTAWLVNDHVLKRAAPSMLTCLLSDAAGLVAFPIVLLGLVPRTVLERMGVRGAVLLCTALTASVFVGINVHAGASEAIGPVLSLLPRLHAAARSGSAIGLLEGGSAHVADVSDLVVLPLAMVPLRLAERARLARVVGAFAVALSLGALPARALADARPALEASAVLGGATGTDGLYQGQATYTLAGARFRFTNATEHARMALHGTFMRGRLTSITRSYLEFGAFRTRHHGFALGGSFGFSYRYFLLDIGMCGARVRTERGRGDAWQLPLAAYVRLIAGPRGAAAITMQGGSTDAFLTDARVFDVGIYVERYAFTLRGAIGLGALMLPDIASDESFLEGTALRARRVDQSWDVIFDFEGAFRLARGVAGTLHVQTGTQRARAALGLRVDLH